MTDDPDVQMAALLAPIPLSEAAGRRIAGRIRREVEARRRELLESALHGGFALAAVAWALLICSPH